MKKARTLLAILVYVAAAVEIGTGFYLVYGLLPLLPEVIPEAGISRGFLTAFPVISVVLWVFLGIAALRSRHLAMPLSLPEKAMPEARLILCRALLWLAGISSSAFLAQEWLILSGLTIPFWGFLLILAAFLTLAIHAFFQLLRLAQSYGIREEDLSEEESRKILEDFMRDSDPKNL
ncbi:MAG: hypothetical protein IKZ21_02640 [Clostridia bacterium]|nr:hypothetical protein [Clostridia bacterium]